MEVDMAEESKEISREEVAAAMERYPGLPAPLAVSRYMIDQMHENAPIGQLTAGSAWGGVHLEQVGQLVQRLAEAVYHQRKEAVTIRLVSEDYPWDYDHWGIEVKEVELGENYEPEPSPLTDWPCCGCDETIQADDAGCQVVLLDKLATWDYPTYGNVLEGTGGRALGVLCGKCVEAKRTASHAVKKDGEKFTRVPLEELEDINGRKD
jgi:hypothetical protein